MSQPTPASILITLNLADFDRWKTVFDANQHVRKDAGLLGHQIYRSDTNPNEVSMFMPASDRSRLASFLDSAQLRAIMAEAGVTSAPRVKWLTAIEDKRIYDRPMAAMVITHEVADFNAWKKVYDAVEPLRREFGTVGASVSQVEDSPNQVVIVHQAATKAELESFVASSELKQAMKVGGVKGAPQIQFFSAFPAVTY